jgi:hypothetical protein
MICKAAAIPKDVTLRRQHTVSIETSETPAPGEAMLKVKREGRGD